MSDKIVVARKCPYPVVRHVAPVVPVTKVERFDFQIGEGGKIERVSLGEFDLLKEVDSHKQEVGLINFIKMAQAKGLDPLAISAKTEAGLPVLNNVETLDDLMSAKASADNKLATIAESYGLTVDQLIKIVQTGDFGSLVEKKEENKTTEGGAE